MYTLWSNILKKNENIRHAVNKLNVREAVHTSYCKETVCLVLRVCYKVMRVNRCCEYHNATSLITSQHCCPCLDKIYFICYIEQRIGVILPFSLLLLSHLQTVFVPSVPRQYFNTIMTASPDIKCNTKCVFMYGADESQEHIVRPVLRNEHTVAGNILGKIHER